MPSLSCPGSFPALPVLPWLSYLSNHMLAALSLKSCPGSLVLAVLSWQSCSAYPFLHFLFCLSCLPVILYRSCSACPVLFCLSYPLVLPWRCIVLAVLSRQPWCWQSCPGNPLWQSFQSCSAFPVLPALFCLPFSACPVLPVKFAFPVLLSSSDCPVLPVLSCLSVHACSVRPVLHVRPVLTVLFSLSYSA
jgi:hypothetical protein